jgi:predicted  nucleic acid-binding Zn-ribbon protein
VSKLSAARLKQLVKLSKRKEDLLVELQNIDRQMVKLEKEFREARRQPNRKARLTFSSERRKRTRSPSKNLGG